MYKNVRNDWITTFPWYNLFINILILIRLWSELHFDSKFNPIYVNIELM